jgi:hypothetical protein
VRRHVWLLALALVACDEPHALPPPAAATTPQTAPAAPVTATATVAAAATAFASAAPAKDDWLLSTLRSDSRLSSWLEHADTLRLQIVVTAVEPDKPWRRYAFRENAEYFYPASAIKTFLAIAALRSMNERAGYDVPALTRINRCATGRPGCEPPPEDQDRSGKKKHQKLRIGSELRKLLSYSDNDSYNRLWDIVGQAELNTMMAELGFDSVRFHHRMNAPAERSKRTQRVLLLPPGKSAVVVPKRSSDQELKPTPASGLEVGSAHHAGGRRVKEPMSFAHKNHVSLRDLQHINVSLLFPERKGSVDLGLSDDQHERIIKALTGRLSPRKFADEHKPMLPGVLEVWPAKQIRYVSKSGRAYGFHLENAYIEHLESKRAFFVTVTIYANPNGVLNDDDYDYDDTSKPLMAALGEVLTRALLKP